MIILYVYFLEMLHVDPEHFDADFCFNAILSDLKIYSFSS